MTFMNCSTSWSTFAMSLNQIKEFKGQYRFLSNFYMAPVEFMGTTWPSSEHAYMAAKTHNAELQQAILQCPTPGEAKKLGRRLKLRPDWESVKVSLMETILRSKFSHPQLRDMLRSTGNAELIEGNWWGDKIWGVCLKTNQGQNLLGKTLMKIRAEIQQPNIQVVNKHHKMEGEYIGRGSPLGNPFPIGTTVNDSREAVIGRYRIYLADAINRNEPKIIDELNRLGNIAMDTGELRLQCFCYPKQCHGDIIKQVLLKAIGEYQGE
jgi:ribA/ribD-fused uncharacterized protein